MNPLRSIMICLVCVFGCELSESDRCKGGLVWDEAVKLCRVQVVDSGDEPGTGDTSVPDAGPDAGEDTGEDTSDDAATFGTPCTGNEECLGEINFCLTNPLAPGDPGICTIENCTAGDCPEAYRCCDCSIWGAAVACMPEENASTAAASGCTCS
jgi:hypothetical protein